MIGNEDIGLILTKEECRNIRVNIDKIIAKAKDNKTNYYKFLQKHNLIKFMEKLKQNEPESIYEG